jgi:hypothetical protein
MCKLRSSFAVLYYCVECVRRRWNNLETGIWVIIEMTGL